MRQVALANDHRVPVAKIEDRMIDTSAGELPARIIIRRQAMHCR